MTHQWCDWVNAINSITINAFNIWPLTYVNAQCATNAIKLASRIFLKKKMFLHNKKKKHHSCWWNCAIYPICCECHHHTFSYKTNGKYLFWNRVERWHLCRFNCEHFVAIIKIFEPIDWTSRSITTQSFALLIA